jgi:D-lactate dehydrogenase
MHLVFDHLEPEELALVESAFAGHQVTIIGTLRADTAIPADTDILSVFVDSLVTRTHIESAPNLKLIAARSMGVDHIDAAAKEKGIVIASVPAYGTHTVAEFAFALMLAVSRKVLSAQARLKNAHTVDARESEGFDLHGKTLGIVGTGKIGKTTARIGTGFGMRVVLYDVMQDEAFANELGAPYVSLDDIAAQADVISLHVPLLPTTKHLVNAEFLSKCKPGAILINTSRGGVVDSVALKDALATGKLAGAGLDVFEGEKEIFGVEAGTTALSTEAAASQALLEMPNVVMTPHVAYDTREAKREILETTLANIKPFVMHEVQPVEVFDRMPV